MKVVSEGESLPALALFFFRTLCSNLLHSAISPPQIPPTEVGGSLMCCLPSRLARPLTRIPPREVGGFRYSSRTLTSPFTIYHLPFNFLEEKVVCRIWHIRLMTDVCQRGT